jgi:hypothetical protein
METGGTMFKFKEKTVSECTRCGNDVVYPHVGGVCDDCQDDLIVEHARDLAEQAYELEAYQQECMHEERRES